MLIDTHCHLDADEFALDRDAVVASARAAGVGWIVVPSVGPNSWGAVRWCSLLYPGCFSAYGIHPLYTAALDDSALRSLKDWIGAELDGDAPPVAIGEIGLDYYYPGYDAERQEYFFVEQLKMARDFDLPVLLHIRRAVDTVLKCLRRIKVRGGIAHAFNGSYQQAETFINLGFKLGMGGAMTFTGSSRIRQLASTLPLCSLVLETDSPDIPPSWLSGQRNSPVELSKIAQVFAELRGISRADVAAATSKNALKTLQLVACCDKWPDLIP